LEIAPMMLRNPARLAALLLLTALPARAADSYSLKVVEAKPPKEVQEEVSKTLGDRSIQLLDGKNEVLVQVWFRKELPAKATDAQIKNGLTYREIPETTLFGVMQVHKQVTDYRKQAIKPGVYTLRLAFQPMDGDHMGTAPYGEFCLASPAADDKSPATMAPKALHELSTKSTNNHPGVFLLFPPAKDAGEPKLANKGDGHWVLTFKQDVTVGGKKATIGIGLTLIGTSASA
jgi:hypothetical protein